MLPSRALATIALFLGCTAPLAAQQDQATNQPEAPTELLGDWEVIDAIDGSDTVEDSIGTRIRFTETQMILLGTTDGDLEGTEFGVDYEANTQSMPPQIDMFYESYLPEDLSRGEPEVAMGIYSIESNTEMTICIASPGMIYRPDTLEPSEGVMWVHLRRVQ